MPASRAIPFYVCPQSFLPNSFISIVAGASVAPVAIATKAVVNYTP